jgi:hypothetical protein
VDRIARSGQAPAENPIEEVADLLPLTSGSARPSGPLPNLLKKLLAIHVCGEFAIILPPLSRSGDRKPLQFGKRSAGLEPIGLVADHPDIAWDVPKVRHDAIKRRRTGASTPADLNRDA